MAHFFVKSEPLSNEIKPLFNRFINFLGYPDQQAEPIVSETDCQRDSIIPSTQKQKWKGLRCQIAPRLF